MANESNSGGNVGFEPKTGDPWYGPVPPDPWYIADGSVIDVDEAFRVDMEIPVGQLEAIFSERAAQPAPNDRISWRSWFPGSVIPVAMFPCTDPGNSNGELRDVVDGQVLTTPGTEIYYRRLASGLYASDYRGRFRFNPIRGIEFANETEESFVAGTKHDLDPLGVSVEFPGPYSISGFLVARLRGTGLLMKKLKSGGAGWKLTVEDITDHEGHLRLTYFDTTSTPKEAWVEVAARHDVGHWFGVLFSIEYMGGSEPYVKLRLFTPHGYFLDSSHELNSDTYLTELPAPWPESGSLPVIDDYFTLGGAVGQIAIASYWQGPADKYELATSNNFHRLWRGTVFPPNVAERPGLVLWRDQVMAWKVGETLGGGDTVVKFGPGFVGVSPDREPDVVPQDPFEEIGGERILPHDEDRENLLTHSEDFSQWTGGASDREAESPEGMRGGYELKRGDTPLTASVVLGSTGAHVFSVWGRSKTGGAVVLELDEDGGETVTSTTHLTKRWTRVSLVNEDPDNDPADISIGAGGIEGSSIEIWGAQLQKGTAPTAYIPTTDTAVTASFEECYADFDVLPGPRRDYGKMEIILMAAPELVGDNTGEYAAFEVKDENDNFLRIWGKVGVDGDSNPTIAWSLDGQLWNGEDPPLHWGFSTVTSEPIPLAAWTPLKVAVRWHQKAIELWVDDELAGKTAPTGDPLPPVSFCPVPDPPVDAESSPCRCDMMRDYAETPDDHKKWIGGCKELRWWR